MTDVLLLMLLVAAFAGAVGYVYACVSLVGQDPSSADKAI